MITKSVKVTVLLAAEMPPPAPPLPPKLEPLMLGAPSDVLPLVTVNPEIATVPDVIVKMRKLGVPCAVLRCMVNRLDSDPVIVRLDEMSGRAVNSVMVAVPFEVREGSNVIVLPEQALVMASRKLLAPLSFVLVTTGLVVQTFRGAAGG